ncbi:hypothetical protein LSPH24S_03744 [Lysinibacillus sphaericus]
MTYTQFYNTVVQMIQSNMFDFVAHLDNFKVFNYHVQDEAFNLLWYEQIAQALVTTQTATEINAGLYYRYPVKEMCPGPTIFASSRETRCRVYRIFRRPLPR